MINIKQIVKLELSNWSKREIIIFSLIYVFLFFNALILNDSPISLISAVCGISYSIIAGKGKISCYFFGLCGSLLYVYLSVRNAIWANAILYGLYYIPMEITGIVNWSKNLNKKQEIIKTRLNTKSRIYLTLLILFITTCVILCLYPSHDSHPIIDGTTTVLSIFGMYLTVKRCIEQWIIWAIANTLSLVMWINIILQGEKAYSTAIMWFIYLVMSFYFYNQWKEDLENKPICN